VFQVRPAVGCSATATAVSRKTSIKRSRKPAGIAMPPEYGGAGLGITEAALMMQTISESGAAFSGAPPCT
jgi:hypothetical protein